MTELISIRESSKHVDEEVRMHVWLTDKRSSGKIACVVSVSVLLRYHHDTTLVS
ncbi:hypothetical protein ACIA4B_07780 [Lactobacillus delbrueckii subsp. bulgaricus]